MARCFVGTFSGETGNDAKRGASDFIYASILAVCIVLQQLDALAHVDVPCKPIQSNAPDSGGKTA